MLPGCIAWEEKPAPFTKGVKSAALGKPTLVKSMAQPSRLWIQLIVCWAQYVMFVASEFGESVRTFDLCPY